MLDFGRAICGDLVAAERREWLVTNGIGGFASGTIAGSLTRRYHGLLLAALSPPLGRTLLLAKLDEVAVYVDTSAPLSTNRWASGAVDPPGFLSIERFFIAAGTPVWQYAVGDALLEKRIWMQQGANTTYIHYALLRGSAPLTLYLRALVNFRDYHGTTRVGQLNPQVEAVEHGLRCVANEGAAPLHLLSAQATANIQQGWVEQFFLALEHERGLPAVEDHALIGELSVTLAPGASVTVVASTEEAPALDGAAALNERVRYNKALLAQAPVLTSRHRAPGLPQRGISMRSDFFNPSPAEEAAAHLVLAADQFIVTRDDGDDAGSTVIAGYHWFSDWGRDTMIALPGLTIPTGRLDVAARVLRTFARYIDQGMLPNRFPDAGEEPEYNTVDATLWFFEALRSYRAASGDDDLIRQLLPQLQDIVAAHQQGTRYSIRVDPEDGLLFAGADNDQLTWMDARVDGVAITARHGKPVEINALWYNALRTIATFAEDFQLPFGDYVEAAERAAAGFASFWNAETGCLFDVIDGPKGDDASIRPNQIFAASLHYSALSESQQRSVVEVCARHLLNSYGLRTLDLAHPAFRWHFVGGREERDGMYHQGPTWAWLIGPFVSAHLRVFGDKAAARRYLLPLMQHLTDAGLGSISELFDGQPPYTPRGTIAQAWSVAEVLRAWYETLE
jgi:glycogen debranching enzyme